MAYGLESYQADLGDLPPPWEARVSECVHYNGLGGDTSLLDFCGYLFFAFTSRYTPKVGRILYWMKQNTTNLSNYSFAFYFSIREYHSRLISCLTDH
jgi:hypothetical protein